MDIKDLIITPIYLIILLMSAYFLRPIFTNNQTRKYFIPALLVRFFGAITLGLIYQFYYGGGDTFNYFNHGSKWIYEAFSQDLITGLKMLLHNGGERPLDKTFEYSSNIWYYRDARSYTIVKITALFDLITFHTYSATSLFFAIFSFSGSWAFFSALNKRYPNMNNRNVAIAVFFIPSVVFWGSGILKDTVTLGALGWLLWSLIHLIDLRFSLIHWIVMVLSALLILRVKSYILLALVPAVFIWIYFKFSARLSGFQKLFISPLILVSIIIGSYFSLEFVSKINDEYTLENVAKRAAITAYDIRYGWGATAGGDGGYDIGIPDGTPQGMLKLMPAAINVTLFRPYLWEVRNPLMLLSSLEALTITFLFARFMYLGRWSQVRSDPFLFFVLIFTLIFAFSIGASTFNFGTLMRYKIPILTPFILVLLKIK